MPRDDRDADEMPPHENRPNDDELARMALEDAATQHPSPQAPPPTSPAHSMQKARPTRRARAAGLATLGLAATAELLREAFWLPPFALPRGDTAAVDLMPYLRFALLLAGFALLAGSAVAARRSPQPIPNEEDLDSSNAERRNRIALATLTAIAFVTVRWWSIHGPPLAAKLYSAYATATFYWTEVATPEEKALWSMLLSTAILACGLAAWLLHRFVWRAFFPDLVRQDPEHHRGGRPERIGRLFRTRTFRTADGRVLHRVFYKHGNRLLPVFRFDHFDVEARPRMVLYGVSEVRCGRLELDPRKGRFKRVPNPARHGSAPLETEFREAEVVEDHNRKTSIVMPGSAMNPEVMRQKFREERLINPHVARKSRDAMRPLKFVKPHREGGVRTGPAAHVDRLDEPNVRTEE